MKDFHEATTLVLGGAGFIGSNFIRKVLKDHPRAHIVCVDALTYAGTMDNLRGLPQSRFVFVKGDIADRAHMARIMKKYAPPYIINFAAESHVDRSIHGTTEVFMRTNVIGTATLLDVAKEFPIKKFVQVSTDEVYGSLGLESKKRFTEQSPLAPNSPYAASKASSDLVSRAFHATYGVPVVITRCSNNYGPYQHPEKLIPYSISCLQKGKPIQLYGDGQYVRDWIHVDDHCDALIRVLRKGKAGAIYNIGANDEVSNLAVAKLLVKQFDKSPKDIVFVQDRPGHDRRYAIDSLKIKTELGWRPRHTFGASFTDTVLWYVEHADWVARALKRAGGANTHIRHTS